MARTTKIIGITLYPEQIEYLNRLNSQGYNRSAIVRKALALYQKARQKLQNKLEDINND